MTRLIDADRLEDDCNLYDKWDAQIVKEWLKTQPTVDAEPLKHGNWIDETFESWGLVHHPFKCNLCGEHAEFASPYCPNCGAKMESENETD